MDQWTRTKIWSWNLKRLVMIHMRLSHVLPTRPSKYPYLPLTYTNTNKTSNTVSPATLRTTSACPIHSRHHTVNLLTKCTTRKHGLLFRPPLIRNRNSLWAQETIARNVDWVSKVIGCISSLKSSRNFKGFREVCYLPPYCSSSRIIYCTIAHLLVSLSVQRTFLIIYKSTIGFLSIWRYPIS